MKFQGKVSNWNDDKGFGFVEPNGGGERAFVHIKAFTPRSRRPINGDLVIYELVRENDNRYKAKNIKFTRDVKSIKKQSKIKSGTSLSSIFTIVFFISSVVSVFIGKLPIIVIGAYILISGITYIAYAIDKSAAQKGQWRTKESTLHTLSLIGGWPGALFAQNQLRHKSSKVEFKNFYWVTVLLNLVGFFWLYTEKGTEFINNVVTPLPIG